MSRFAKRVCRNMDSSKVAAFSRFETWKKSHTVLKLVVYERGAEDHFTGSIIHVDFDEDMVTFVDGLTHNNWSLDLRASAFEVTPDRVVVLDEKVGKLVFEVARFN